MIEINGLWWFADRTWRVTEAQAHADAEEGTVAYQWSLAETATGLTATVVQRNGPRPDLTVTEPPDVGSQTDWQGYLPSDVIHGQLAFIGGLPYRVVRWEVDATTTTIDVTLVGAPDYPYIDWLRHEYNHARSYSDSAVKVALLHEVATVGGGNPTLNLRVPLSPVAQAEFLWAAQTIANAPRPEPDR